MVVTVLRYYVHISVKAMTTDSVVTALSVATTFTVLLPSLDRTNVNIAVKALPVVTTVTVLPVVTTVTVLSVVTTTTRVCTVMLQRCHSYRSCTVVSLRR